jgi:hypothetical protein
MDKKVDPEMLKELEFLLHFDILNEKSQWDLIEDLDPIDNESSINENHSLDEKASGEPNE